MAHPHEYIGTGANPPGGTAGESYEESWQATPFPGVTGTEYVPGNHTEVEITVSHRYITDDGLTPTNHTVVSTTSDPAPHIEYGRVS